MASETQSVAKLLLDALQVRGETLSCAESFTSGLLSAQIITPPGASNVLVGSLIAYATRTKIDLLGVDADLIAKWGTVSSEVAISMARGARKLFDTQWALATTGVAGPEYHEGHPPGTLFVAISGGRGREQQFERVEKHSLEGTRTEVCHRGADLAVRLAVEVISRTEIIDGELGTKGT